MDISKEVEAFRSALRSRGLPATPQRLKLAEIVFSTHEHFTADELFAWARKRRAGIGRVTVYRTLKVMVEAGLVEERTFQKDRVLYEHVVGHPHHDHMVCLGCRGVIEFSSRRIEAEQDRVARSHRFKVVHHSHTLFGYCRSCRTTPRRNGSSSIPRKSKDSR
jgi:Fur family transcriptional regulator, ferric uptake regulator